MRRKYLCCSDTTEKGVQKLMQKRNTNGFLSMHWATKVIIFSPRANEIYHSWIVCLGKGYYQQKTLVLCNCTNIMQIILYLIIRILSLSVTTFFISDKYRVQDGFQPLKYISHTYLCRSVNVCPLIFDLFKHVNLAFHLWLFCQELILHEVYELKQS